MPRSEQVSLTEMFAPVVPHMSHVPRMPTDLGISLMETLSACTQAKLSNWIKVPVASSNVAVNTINMTPCIHGSFMHQARVHVA